MSPSDRFIKYKDVHLAFKFIHRMAAESIWKHFDAYDIQDSASINRKGHLPTFIISFSLYLSAF